MQNAERVNDTEIADSLVPQTLSGMMRVDVVLGKDGKLSILHDQLLPFPLKWVEYDGYGGGLVLFSQKGDMLPVGINLPESMTRNIAEQHEMAIARVENGKVEDMYIVSFVYNGTA